MYVVSIYVVLIETFQVRHYAADVSALLLLFLLKIFYPDVPVIPQ